MKYLTGQEIRKMWLSFFASKGHFIEKGASLIPHNDPTLLWINSGVAALKKYFDGSEVPCNRRICNAQKSLRTNDVEHVGYTARHHTFFEMLGNFSIGDYFRHEAIVWAFELLTSDQYFGISVDKLYFTYHPQDLATKEEWRKLGVSEDHLIPVEGNFWEIGEGPCGPNTEMFFDRGEKYDPEKIGTRLIKEDLENDRYIEIWNIVFSQFNAVSGVKREHYKELPQKNIDTGAGLERIACVLQETETNFETDLFMPIIKAASQLTKIAYTDDSKMAYRVIADHIRTCTFAVADGAIFSNEGRGYVLRRVLRRAMRFARKLNINEPFLYKLVPEVIKIMQDFYPYLISQEEVIQKSIAAEENKFLKTLATGEAMLRKMLENSQGKLSGADAFKLYDTFGFPIELTVEMCQEAKVTVDVAQFNNEMEAQKERARAARGNLQSMNRQAKDLMAFVAPSTFVYENDDLDAKVIAIFKNGVQVDELDDEGDVIFDRTNFYAESGGQISDSGKVKSSESEFSVISVVKAPNKQHLHHLFNQYGTLKVGDQVKLVIDKTAREKIRANHSAVHILQRALHEVFGNNLCQQGSFVSDQYFRFDFNYDQKLSDDELKRVENIVNDYISQAIPCSTLELPVEEAKKLNALALFDEKYGEIVRVVCFGEISKEFCGGTHVNNSSSIGVFAIQFCESIAAGVRRIQGTTGLNAYKYLKSKEDKLMQLAALIDCPPSEVVERYKSLINENKDNKKTISHQLDMLAAGISKNLEQEFKKVGEIGVLIKYLPSINRQLLVKINDHLKTIYHQSIIVLIGEENGTLPIVSYVSSLPNQKGYKAGNLVKEVATILQGSGGGASGFACGSGKNSAKIPEAIEHLKKLIKE